MCAIRLVIAVAPHCIRLSNREHNRFYFYYEAGVVSNLNPSNGGERPHHWDIDIAFLVMEHDTPVQSSDLFCFEVLQTLRGEITTLGAESMRTAL
jgi:hypothetical protein